MDLIFVAVGGALGSLARFKLGNMILLRSNSAYPIGIIIINISGAIFLGIATAFDFSNNINLLLADGFLGAYTTFSTFMYQGFNLFHDKKKLNAIIYISITLFIGIISFFIGFKVSENFLR